MEALHFDTHFSQDIKQQMSVCLFDREFQTSFTILKGFRSAHKAKLPSQHSQKFKTICLLDAIKRNLSFDHVVTYGPVRPLDASGPGVDPLQGSGDPWGRGQQENPGLSFAPVSSATVIPLSPDGSGNSSGTWQTGQSATASTPVSTSTFGMPPGFLDVSGRSRKLWTCHTLW